MERNVSKRVLEYSIYILILAGCITGLYWRFWYRPPVNPVVVLDPKSLQPSADMKEKPMLDPDFRWSLIRTDLRLLTAYFREDGQERMVSIGPGEELGGWRLKRIAQSSAVMVKKGEERVVYLQPPPSAGK